MTRVHLDIKDAAYERFMNVLKEFKNDEVKIVSDDSHFEANKLQLNKDLVEIRSGKSTSYSIEEVEESLELIILKHENSSKSEV
jgi:hypothetical protein